MTPAEFKKKLIDFELRMQDYHDRYTIYDRRSLSIFSEIANIFIKRKQAPGYQDILDDLESIKEQLSEYEYEGLRKRIITAYKN